MSLEEELLAESRKLQQIAEAPPPPPTGSDIGEKSVVSPSLQQFRHLSVELIEDAAQMCVSLRFRRNDRYIEIVVDPRDWQMSGARFIEALVRHAGRRLDGSAEEMAYFHLKALRLVKEKFGG